MKFKRTGTYSKEMYIKVPLGFFSGDEKCENPEILFYTFRKDSLGIHKGLVGFLLRGRGINLKLI